jgi:hypothetical protein
VAQDPVAPLIRTLLETPDKGEPMRRLLSELVSNSNLFDALVEVEGATNFSSVIELARQRKGARALHAVINNPVSTLAEIREVLRSEWWVFGSRYIPAFSRGRIPVLQQIDLPLIRSDGAVHLIALGEANIGDLVVPAEDGYQVGPRVPELVNRAMNQLLILETQAAAIRDILGVESRRAFATLVIGHPAYVAGQVSKDNVRSTLRTFSSHLSGLEIMTYKDLMDSAEKTLDLVERAQLDPHSMFGGAG